MLFNFINEMFNFCIKIVDTKIKQVSQLDAFCGHTLDIWGAVVNENGKFLRE